MHNGHRIFYQVVILIHSLNCWSEQSACASATKWPLNYAFFLSPLSLSPLSSRRLLKTIEGGVVGF